MQQRRLAAIMFTDIVGYTSLMGSEEKRAFDVLRKSRRLHWRIIKKYNGRLLKEMGDGMLASFPSSIDAAICALAIQAAAIELEIPLRLGIHQGDVIFEKKDVLGDGVNIASRIQGLADTNAVVVSETVYQDIRNKAGLEIKFLGPQKLKGVSIEMGVYNVSCSDLGTLDISVDTGELVRPLGMRKTTAILGSVLVVLLGFSMYFLLPRWLSNTETNLKSIMVLPFYNYTGSDSLNYQLAGMHSALNGELGRISGFRVLSEYTARAYNGKGISLAQIAEEQGLDYIVESSAMCLGDSICIQLKLMSVSGEEQQIWINDYNYNLSQVLNFYSEVTKEISHAINVVLTPEEERMLVEKREVDPEAYKLYQQGRYFWLLEGLDNLEKSLEYYDKALEIDPEFALAYVGKAITYTSFGWYLYKPKDEIIKPAKEAALRALEIDKDLGPAHAELAFARLLDWDWFGSEESFKVALKYNSSDARTYHLYSYLLSYLGRHKEAIENSRQAHILDPMNVDYWTNLGRRYYFARDYDKAIEEYNMILEIYPDNSYSTISWFPRSELAMAFSMKGMHAKAIEEYSKIEFEKSYHWHLGYIYGNAGEREKAIEILNYYLELSKKEYVSSAHIAIIYVGLGEITKAFDWLENPNENRNGWLLHLNEDPMCDPLRTHPRFQTLLDRVNFPD